MAASEGPPAAVTQPRPPRLERRFEAVVFDWDGTAVADRRSDAGQLRRLVEALCAAGMEVAVVSGTNLGIVDGQLRARPRGPGRLFLLLNRGSEAFVVDGSGPHLAYRRAASSSESRLLTAAAKLTVNRLAVRGLTSEIVSRRLNRRKIDLIPLAEWAQPSKARIADTLQAVELRLLEAGIGSLREAVAVAKAAAHEVGLSDPRVTSDAKHIEIGLTDKSHSARWILGELWSRGIGAGLVLIAGDEFGPLGGLPGSDSLMLVAEAGRATAVSVGVEPNGVPPGVDRLPGGPGAFLDLLEDQLRLRRERCLPEIDLDPAWTFTVDGVDHELERVHESLLGLGDGRFGTSGAPLDFQPATSPRVLAAGVYTQEGPDAALVACPLWDRSGRAAPDGFQLRRVLDLRTGVLAEEVASGQARRRAFRFSSLGRPGTMLMRVDASPELMPTPAVLVSPDGDPPKESGTQDGRSWMRVVADVGGVVAAATAATEVRSAGTDRGLVERIASYVADPCRALSPDAALGALAAAEEAGFDRLLAEHRSTWAGRWTEADIRIEGDAELEQAVRFAIFHLIGSSAASEEAAVGARGISGTAYRGHVFWDSDVFVLPFFAATHPAAARAMLEYRLRRLPAAMEAARSLGREGARFPWESAGTGRDVTPRLAHDQLGREIEIRTGLLEEHIVADVAWAAQSYLDWSADRSFQAGPARTLFVETARYWASRIRLGEDGRAHIDDVIGPDEYHENVDDNAFTNVMARWNLRRAARTRGVGAEGDRWRRLAGLLVDGYDRKTMLYEQFTGFWKLEPLVIRDLVARRPVAADLLLGRERIREAQVVKQADVLMLHHLVPDLTAPGSLEPNLDFYEPRTAHGSSLSSGVHAALLARVGRLDEALGALRMTARLDLDDLTRTTAGGLHLAAMAGLWQALVFGFAGVRPSRGWLLLDPHLPPTWQALEIPLTYHGGRLRLRIEPETLWLEADRPLAIRFVGTASTRVAAGTSCYRRQAGAWKEVAP